MSPRPLVNHARVSGNIYRKLSDYLQSKSCEAFPDGLDLYLNKSNRFVPDCMVVCNKDIIKHNGIYGAPDLVVEVSSPSTVRYDRGHKKNAYAKAGVKEYWIVGISDRVIEVYLLKDGDLMLDDTYTLLQDYDLEKMNDEEKACFPTEFKCSLFSDFTISLEDVFTGID